MNNRINPYSDENVHEEVYKHFDSINSSDAPKILILGSGEGAFEKLLLDNGYNNITSIDINPNAVMIIKSTVPVGFTQSIKEKFNCNNISYFNFTCIITRYTNKIICTCSFCTISTR